MARQDYVYKKNLQSFVKKKKSEAVDYDQIVDDGDSWALLISYFRWYPDALDRVFESEKSDFRQQFPQVLMMRAMARYQNSYITAARGMTKTYTAVKEKAKDGIVWPNSQIAYVSPSLVQTAPLASAAWKQISKDYPAITQHYSIQADSRDHFEIVTQYNSNVSIVAKRGYNLHQVVAEEYGQEEAGQQFDHAEFRRVVLPTVRLQHMVHQQPDPTFIYSKKSYITSACTQQNEAFETHQTIYKDMISGGSSIVMDMPWEVSVLCGLKPYEYYSELQTKLTPDEFLRECGSQYTGSSENPIIRDSKLTESKKLTVMEESHCQRPDVIYIVGYDVAYEDGAGNAKCASSVLKCERQLKQIKGGAFLKSIVNVNDFPPPGSDVAQAKRLKELWARFCYVGSETTYIAIDSQHYGTAVLEKLHGDLGDGLPPLCCVNHEHANLELDGALPVIYPIKATGGQVGTHDPDGDMIRYCELEWEHGNVQILTTNIYEGVEAYKRAHHIKDDSSDRTIQRPYQKTRELCAQISNLKKKVTGTNMGETRISTAIQRDMWSATKYAMRYAKILEDEERALARRKDGEWENIANSYLNGELVGESSFNYHPRVINRIGGNLRK